MRKTNINDIGKGSLVGLAVLGLMLASPMTVGVWAEEKDDTKTIGAVEDLGDTIENDAAADEEAGISPQLVDVSVVNISFNPASGAGSMIPTSSAGASARFLVVATVNVQNSGGYSVYFGSKNPNLTRVGGTEVIPPVSGSVAYDDMQANTWGVAYAAGNTIADDVSYSAISTAGSGVKVGENANRKIVNDTKTFALSFAANISNDMPAGVYQNQVTMSVVSSPVELTIFDITTMQEMTTGTCENTVTPLATATTEATAFMADQTKVPTAQLRDDRDGKYYWIAKLADGKCWMTQNLDLELSTNKALTPSDSDVIENWTPEFDTATVASVDTILDDTVGQRSWSLGDYWLTDNSNENDCGYGRADAEACVTRSKLGALTTPSSQNYAKDAHYLLGNYYQWNAATAGTGGTIETGQASSSICPRGWRLPESNATTAGSFGGLFASYSITNENATSMLKLTSAPLYFARSGYIQQKSKSLLGGVGDRILYWSSTPFTGTYEGYEGLAAYSVHANSADVINPSDAGPRYYGFSVRCVAR